VSLQEGKRIAITAKIKDGIGSVLSGDDVELYVVLYNSHDGTLQVGMMFSNIRVVCANTLGAAISDRKRKGDYAQFEKGDDLAVTAKSVRAKHTKNLHQNMALVQGTIDVAKRDFNLTLEQYRNMAKTPMNEALFREYLCRVYDYDVEMKPNAQGKTIKDMRGYNQILKNFEAGVGIDIKGVKGTLWQGYQAVTQHITHAKDGSALDDQRKRLNQILFGTAADLTQKAHNVAVEMIAR
jgi:phage/plasmid-like protein (TIGR03299 family)